VTLVTMTPPYASPLWALTLLPYWLSQRTPSSVTAHLPPDAGVSLLPACLHQSVRLTILYHSGTVTATILTASPTTPFTISTTPSCNGRPVYRNPARSTGTTLLPRT